MSINGAIGKSFGGNLRLPIVFPLENEGNIDQADENGHLYQRTDHRGKSFSRVDPENCHCNRNRQFEIVARRCERQSCGL